MFFHLDMGINKVAHEWLSWVLLIGVALHLVPNFNKLKQYLSMRNGQLMIGGFALLLILSFAPIGGDKGEQPFVQPLNALSNAPLTTLALVAETTPEELLERLSNSGIPVESKQQSVSELAGSDFRKRVRILSILLTQERKIAPVLF